MAQENEETERPNPEQVRHYLFLAFFAALRRSAIGVDFDTIEREAKAALNQMRAPDEATWASAVPMSAFAAKRSTNVGRVVRIAGRIAEMHDPQLATLRDENGVVRQYDTTSIEILDVNGRDAIWSLDVLGEDLIERLYAHRSDGATIEFLGVIVSLPTKLNTRRPDVILGDHRADFLLHILAVRGSTNAFDVLGATASERARADELLSQIQAAEGKSPLEWLRDRVVTGLGIQGLDKFPLLRELIEFTVLQAVAIGRVGNSPGNAHLLLIGPPGRGKKLVGVAAKSLNPISVDVSASKVSAAGLAELRPIERAVGSPYRVHCRGRQVASPSSRMRTNGLRPHCAASVPFSRKSWRTDGFATALQAASHAKRIPIS